MKKLAIYAGSFNPFTIGHLNILQKSKKIFENTVVAIGVNPLKVETSTDELLKRAKKLSEKLNVQVEVYTTFLHELIEKKESEGYQVVDSEMVMI